MARLIDHLLRSKGIPEMQATGLRRATVIVADNVADYVFTRQQADYRSTIALPNVAPPLRELFVEFRVPKIGGVGWLLHSSDLQDVRHVAAQYMMRTTPASPGDARWYVRGYLFYEALPPQPQLLCELYVSPDGRLCPIQTGPNAVQHYTVEPTEGSVYAEAYAQEPIGKWLLGPSVVLHVALWTLCFMHTKNVQLEDQAPPPKLSRRHEKKHGRPLCTFKTLKIQPMRGRRDAAEAQGGAHGAPSLHIRRGHFKTFTDAAPLFGRVVGTYWWEQALVGKAERGLVAKDYQVEIDLKGA